MHFWDEILFFVWYTRSYDEKLPHTGVTGVAQPTRLVIASTLSTPSLGGGLHMHTGHGIRARVAASSSGGQNRTYALADRQNSEASLDVFTCTLFIFHIQICIN